MNLVLGFFIFMFLGALLGVLLVAEIHDAKMEIRIKSKLPLS